MPRVGAIQAAMVIMSCLRMILAGKPKLFNWDTDVDVANVKNAKCPESSVWMAWTNTLDSQALWNKDWAFARDANLDHVKFDSETGVLMQINKEAASESTLLMAAWASTC